MFLPCAVLVFHVNFFISLSNKLVGVCIGQCYIFSWEKTDILVMLNRNGSFFLLSPLKFSSHSIAHFLLRLFLSIFFCCNYKRRFPFHHIFCLVSVCVQEGYGLEFENSDSCMSVEQHAASKRAEFWASFALTDQAPLDLWHHLATPHPVFFLSNWGDKCAPFPRVILAEQNWCLCFYCFAFHLI